MSKIFDFFFKKPEQIFQGPTINLSVLKTSKLPLLCKLSEESLIELLAVDLSHDSDTTEFIWDGLLEKSARLLFETKKASAPFLIEKLDISYNRASNIIDQLERIGIISSFDGQSRKLTVYDSSELEVILNQVNFDIQFIVQFHKDHITEIGASISSTRNAQLDQEKDRREKIPQNVMDKVWNRDEGKCVQCGSQKGLEFDHIIPFSKGGANTYRNLQLLCEKCNREKSNRIGY